MENTNLTTTQSKPVSQGVKRPVTARKSQPRPVAKRSTGNLTRITIETKKKDVNEKKPFPWSTMFMAVCFTVMFLFMMMNYIALDDLSDQVAARASTINELAEERDKLEAEVARMATADEIQKYAENELGMVNGANKIEEYYIDLHTEDEVEINRYEDENENGIGTLLTGAGNVIKDFFGK
ncbi:MAG: septum formation initiator family protein [Clostridia bacterium]|nr:septum formation initiator family protein [Clostridia bacterium]